MYLNALNLKEAVRFGKLTARCSDYVFLKASPDIGIALVPLTKKYKI